MPDPRTQSEIYRFGAYELRTGTGELRKNGLRLKLQDQPTRILVLLLENAGELVTREQIQKRLWANNIHVDYENAINSAVRKLRDVLSDTSENPRFVETLPRRGYRFVAPATRVECGAPVSEAVPVDDAGPVTKPIGRPLLLVLALLALLAGSAAFAFFHGRTKPEATLFAVPLTSYPGYESSPSFSPDGNQVAFSWNGETGDNYDIYVQLIGSGNPLRVTKDAAPDMYPAWSPDGRSIAFVRFDPKGIRTIMTIPALGGPEREIARLGAAFRNHIWGWTPDSRWLMLSIRDGEEGPSGLFFLSVETGEKRRLTSPQPGTAGDLMGSISPDGRAIAFSRTLTPTYFPSDLYTLHLTPDFLPHGEPTRLTSDNARNLRQIVWTADSRDIVFSSSRSGSIGLWRMPVSGSQKPRRVAVGDNATSLAISLHSNRLIFEQQVPPDYNIWRLDLADPAASPVPFLASTRQEVSAHYSPDGKKIVFHSDRSGTDEIWECDANGSNMTQLTRRGIAGSPRWSPDSRLIAFDSVVGDRWQIFVMDGGGGHPRQLTFGESSNSRPAWSHDGKWIYFSTARSGRLEVWKIAENGGKAIQLTRNGGTNPMESGDGAAIYYNSGSRIMRAAPDGSGETKLVESVGSSDTFTFTLTDRGIYYWKAPPAQLLFFDLAEGKSHLMLTSARQPSVGLSVSPDGHYLLYSQLDGPPGSDLMLVENFR